MYIIYSLSLYLYLFIYIYIFIYIYDDSRGRHGETIFTWMRTVIKATRDDDSPIYHHVSICNDMYIYYMIAHIHALTSTYTHLHMKSGLPIVSCWLKERPPIVSITFYNQPKQQHHQTTQHRYGHITKWFMQWH